MLILELNQRIETHEWPPSQAVEFQCLAALVREQHELAALRRLASRAAQAADATDIIFTSSAYPDYMLGETLADFLLIHQWQQRSEGTG
ncbi:MAG: hypothetical protein KKA73_09255 [Chloroflexi bacterium]|nr:hypothetical protein [Chloroflexota bacterium]MBU1747865.1 hypothetical protein [Chloroflexota bacterium]